MNNKIMSAACAGLFSIGTMSFANADIVDISFTNASSVNPLFVNTMSYSFDVQVSEFAEFGQTFYTSNAVFLGASFTDSSGITNYSAANFGFQFVNNASNGLNTVFEISDAGGNMVSDLMFQGVASFVNDTTNIADLHFEMDYSNPDSGSLTLFNGLNYQIGGEPFTNIRFVGSSTSSSSNVVYEYSEVFVSTTVSAVPIPAAVWLFGSGLIGLAGVARRKT